MLTFLTTHNNTDRPSPVPRVGVQAYAALMIAVYPVGVPVLFAVLLLKRRDQINPPLMKLPDSSPLLASMSSDMTVEGGSGSGGGGGGGGGGQPIQRPHEHSVRGNGGAGGGGGVGGIAKGESGAKRNLSDEGERRVKRFGSGSGRVLLGANGEDRRSPKAFTGGTPADREEVRVCVRRGGLREIGRVKRGRNRDEDDERRVGARRPSC